MKYFVVSKTQDEYMEFIKEHGIKEWESEWFDLLEEAQEACEREGMGIVIHTDRKPMN